jgi:hypothetical protein
MRADVADDILTTGRIPPGSKGNYLSFNKYTGQEVPGGKVQMPGQARYRAEFDMKPYIDNVRIPNGDYGKATYLEPIAEDFPKYGPGGATQAIVEHDIQADRIIDLETGSVRYGR